MVHKGMAKGRRRSHIVTYCALVLIISFIALCVGVKTHQLNEKISEYEVKDELLDTQIAAQEKRADDIEDYSVYVQTKAYIVDRAHKIFNLVNEDEIILKATE